MSRYPSHIEIIFGIDWFTMLSDSHFPHTWHATQKIIVSLSHNKQMESFRQTKKTRIDTNKDSAYWAVENMDANCIGSCMFAAFVL